MAETFRVAVEDWVDYLSDDQLPALAASVHKLTDLTASEDARVSSLTSEVLRDPTLTSRLLQVSNSVNYRNVSGQIATINRAIFWLGFSTVRDTMLSMKILDSVLEHSPSQHLLFLIARSYHTAMQASWMVEEVRHSDREEAFISALLRHLGEMAFLSRDDEVSHRLNLLIDRQGQTPDAAALDVLGCRFDEVTVAIVKRWGLSPLIAETILKPESPRQTVQAILLAEELCTQAIQGWDHPDTQLIMRKIADFRRLPYKDCADKAIFTADLSRKLAASYGAGVVRHLIPDAKTTVANPIYLPRVKEIHLEDSPFQLQLQQQILSFQQAKKLDINELFRVAMDGFCDGLLLKRVALSLVSPDRKQLKTKTTRGGDLSFNAVFDVSMQQENLFTHSIRSAQPLWIGSSAMAGKSYLLTGSILKATKTKHCLVAPIIVSGKPIGVFYADSGEGGEPISDSQFSAFCGVVQQVNLVLTSNAAARTKA
ncbi:Conserved hypothetical protein [gamma proteobacterium HdN1]|nr:Conserved hypothetical protein [gamma proteobacterium HdN1]